MPDTVVQTPDSGLAAHFILDLLEQDGLLTLPIDLDLIRERLPKTPVGDGDTLLAPQPLTWSDAEGALVRHPHDPRQWGIFYNPKARPERRRFTIAHEIGHFALHRLLQAQFLCNKDMIGSGHATAKRMERQADAFASALLMPAKLLKDHIDDQAITLDLLSDLAKLFQVSFEAICLRFIQFTRLHAVLLAWDHGFLHYHCTSAAAQKCKVRLRLTDNPQSPLPHTLAAHPRIRQSWKGRSVSSMHWLADGSPEIPLREMKRTSRDGARMISLLILEPPMATSSPAMASFLARQKNPKI